MYWQGYHTCMDGIYIIFIYIYIHIYIYLCFFPTIRDLPTERIFTMTWIWKLSKNQLFGSHTTHRLLNRNIAEDVPLEWPCLPCHLPNSMLRQNARKSHLDFLCFKWERLMCCYPTGPWSHFETWEGRITLSMPQANYIFMDIHGCFVSRHWKILHVSCCHWI